MTAQPLPAAPDDAEPVIELVAVSKDYVSDGGVVRALRDTTLTIRMGEFVAIVGTSGSGKSTMMNILGCLDRPTHGTYRLAGLDIGDRSNDARALARNQLIGFIFQGFNLLSRTSALENVELPLEYRGVGRRERRALAMEALTVVGLEDRVHHNPNELSGGQQQRVAIARALVTKPPILLADEPTGNLDTRTSLELLAFLQRLNRERKITIVLVTHEPAIAACASRVISVRDGRIVSDVANEPAEATTMLRAMPAAAASPFGATMLMGARPLQRVDVKIPKVIYPVMAVGAVAGLLCGLAYDAWVLDHASWAPPIFGALLGECWAGARVLRSRLRVHVGVLLTARVATPYTLIVSAVLAILISWQTAWWPPAMQARLAGLDGKGLVATVALLVACLGTAAVMRALLLSLFARKPVP